MRRYAYRPRASIPKNVAFGLPNPAAIAVRSDAPPIRLDWHSGDYVGISTDDIAEARTWVIEARKLGLAVSNAAGERRRRRYKSLKRKAFDA